jgi:hypothetical protein
MDLKLPMLLLVITFSLLLSGCIGKDEGGNEGPIDGEETGTMTSHPIGLDEGQTGDMSIPLIGVNFVDTDVKHHWDMPQNVTGVRVNVSWSGASWDVELAIGTGDCPHSGMQLNSSTGGGGQLSTEFWVHKDDSLDMTQWFCHLTLPDPGAHRGESINYVFEVTLFSYEEIDCEGDVCPV